MLKLSKYPLSGFTLIEMLVVVLIIGILAAIALPQYNKAVAKSRFAEAFSNLRAIAQADEACRIGKGGNNEDCGIDELDIEIPGEIVDEGLCGWPAIETDNFYYWSSENCNGGESATALYKKEDVCVCIKLTGELAIVQNDQCRPKRTSFDYAELLNIPSEATCGCC